MRRSSSFMLMLLVLLALPSSAYGQPSPGGGPDAGAVPPASSTAPPPSSGSSAQPPSTGPTGKQPSGGGPSAPAAPIDRGSLLDAPSAGGSPPASSSPATSSSAVAAPAAPAGGAQPEAAAKERRTDASVGANPKDVYAEDWWVHSRPIFELHGYLRVRAELFHGFALGRMDDPKIALFPQPADNSYNAIPGTPHSVAFYCSGASNPLCEDKSQAGANMRLRVNPELHISDNLRILSQIDMLDNLVLGSTPEGYVSGQSSSSPYVPIGAFATTQIPPTAGVNSFTNSIAVKRAWGEYATPLGQLRFGRMPSHWGLGILENSGDGYDSDWQSTVDRIMFTTGLKSLELYVSGTWDFPNEGPTSATIASTNGGQPYDLAQLDDVNQYTLMVSHRRDPELVKGDLARGNLVVNGGAYFQYRDQMLSATSPTTSATNPPLGATADTLQQSYYVRRDLRQFIPDLWVQLLYKKFRFEAEAAMIAGSIGNLSPGPATTFNFRQFGLATQTEFKAIEDRLRLQFGFGWSSGDAGLVPDPGRTSTLSPSSAGTLGIYGPRVADDNTYREFRFHPDYRIDLILNRNILGRVQGEYYFRPSVDYDFSRSSQGQKFGGGAAVIWSRASEFVQAPGHQRDLGVEFDLSLYYQSKDGSLNDNPDKMGGFFTMLQYGILFPLGGLGYLQNESLNGSPVDTSAAHTLRWFLGVLY